MCIENVLQFPASAVEDMLGDLYHVDSIKFAPTDLGYPTQRRRHYLVLLLKGALRWKAAIAEQGGLQSAFFEIFAEKRLEKIPGDCLLRAPQSDVEAWVRRQAVRRNMAERRSCGKEWSSFHVLPPGARSRLQSYEKLLEVDGDNVKEKRPALMANIPQVQTLAALPP